MVLACFLFSTLGGCDNSAQRLQESKRRQDRKQRESGTDMDHLSEAMGYLSRIVTLDQAAAMRQINYHLNAWINSQADSQAAADWKLSPLGENLVARYRAEMSLVAPDSNTFLPGDLPHLRTSYMLSRLSSWVSQGPLHDPLLAQWLSDADNQLSDETEAELATAFRLFDWTVRNIRLEPMQFPPDAGHVVPKEMPPGLTFDAPGYRQTLEQILWRSTGDGIQRSRVFLSLCHQAGIRACMLAIGQATPEQTDAANQVWVAGVLVGDAIYLLDLTLGMPIPGPGQVGVATLRQAIEDESVLRRLNVTGLFEYPVDAEQLKSVSALFDFAPEAYCRRMAVLEKSLAGDNRMRLSALGNGADAFKQHPLIDRVEPWGIGIQAQRYAAAIEYAATDDFNMLFYQRARWAMFTPGTESLSPAIEPIASARWEHLMGHFDRDGDDPGARVMYLAQRRSDAMITRLASDASLQAELKLYRPLGQSEQQFEQFLGLVQMQLRQAKQASSFWQACIQFEDSQYEGSVAWNQKRILDRETASPWASAARYNLGRSLEHLDRVDEAIKFYKTEADPQEHGNRIRARLLARE